jgi:tRNA (pseudouridine54-N1)-methyltransferase
LPSFVVIGQKADAAGEFLPDDLPGTSGRLDVLLRCVRAALLWSHGIRTDVTAYLVLCGGPRAPRTLRIEGASARFVRPDERSLATLARKTLASRVDDAAEGFVEVRAGIALAADGLESVLRDVRSAPLFVLEEGGPDVRAVEGAILGEAAFFLGDHLGFDATVRERLAAAGARPLGIGPRSLHAEDVIAVVLNELDRHSTRPGEPPSDRTASDHGTTE